MPPRSLKRSVASFIGREALSQVYEDWQRYKRGEIRREDTKIVRMVSARIDEACEVTSKANPSGFATFRALEDMIDGQLAEMFSAAKGDDGPSIRVELIEVNPNGSSGASAADGESGADPEGP